MINLLCILAFFYPYGAGWILSISILFLCIPIVALELWCWCGASLIWWPFLLYRLLAALILIAASVGCFLLFFYHGFWLPNLLAETFLINVLIVLTLRIWWFWYPPLWTAGPDGTVVEATPGNVTNSQPIIWAWPGFIFCGFGWFIVLVIFLAMHISAYILFGRWLCGWQCGFTSLVVFLLIDLIILYAITYQIGLLQAVLALFYSKRFSTPVVHQPPPAFAQAQH
jgi:hypothetical protein